MESEFEIATALRFFPQCLDISRPRLKGKGRSSCIVLKLFIMSNKKLKTLYELEEIKKKGFAGVNSKGRIVDRRLFPTAISMKENKLLGIPPPKTVDHQMADLLLFFRESKGCYVRVAGMANAVTKVIDIDVDNSLVVCELGNFDPRRLQYCHF